MVRNEKTYWYESRPVVLHISLSQQRDYLQILLCEVGWGCHHELHDVLLDDLQTLSVNQVRILVLHILISRTSFFIVVSVVVVLNVVEQNEWDINGAAYSKDLEDLVLEEDEC